MNNIPKKIHFCWFGNNPKGDLIEKCIQSWRKKCPDYEIIEWNEKNFDISINEYCKEAYENKCWAFVADFARLWIIYNYGGIYLDTDVELLKNLDDFLEFDSFFCYENETYINTGLGFGATKNNNVVKIMLDEYQDIHFVNNGELDKTPCPVRNTNSIKKYMDIDIKDKQMTIKNNNVILCKDFFCPLDYDSKKLNITDNTYGIHWYNESWLSSSKKKRKKFLVFLRNILGKKIYDKIKNIFK